MNILIVDMFCPKPYSAETLQKSGLGGSEASVVRLAGGLAKRGHCITVVQHNREEACGMYAAPSILEDDGLKPDIVISLRGAVVLPFARQRWPSAKFIILLTDIVGARFWSEFDLLAEAATTIVGLSDFHLTGITDVVLAERHERVWRNISIRKIPLPVDDDLMPDDTVMNPNKLVFFSSPIKGLKETLDLFTRLRQRDPSYELHIANPGYTESIDTAMPGIINHGILTHEQVLKEVRGALCVFYGNKSFPETFGLVFAEANAVGVPVVAYEMGSAPEVLVGNHGNALVSKDNWKRFIDIVDCWHRDGRNSSVTTKNEYRLASVLDKWETLFRES